MPSTGIGVSLSTIESIDELMLCLFLATKLTFEDFWPFLLRAADTLVEVLQFMLNESS